MILIIGVVVTGCTSEQTYSESTERSIVSLPQSTTTTELPTTVTQADTTTTETTGPPIYGWGSELVLNDTTIHVSEPQTDTALTHTDKLFLDNGYGVAYITVTITNDSAIPYSYSPINFLLSDSEGQVFGMSTLCSEPRLESGNLQPGRIVKGAVPFEIPLESTPAYIDYYPAFDGVGTPDNLVATWGYLD